LGCGITFRQTAVSVCLKVMPMAGCHKYDTALDLHILSDSLRY